MNKIENTFNRMLIEKYYTSRELMYDTKVGTFLSTFEYKKLLEYKAACTENVTKLDLYSFNNANLCIFSSDELNTKKIQYFKSLLNDYLKTNTFRSVKNLDEMTRSRIYSEVEGTLNIENVPTTRKVIDEIAKEKRIPQSKNEIIIQNMINAIKFVNKLPEFNKDNLFILYTLLSKDCLDDEDKLLPNHYYRHDGVEVGGYKGCPFEQIEEAMNSLFSFVNNIIENQDNDVLLYDLPHITHYYIVYIHPYFDYNGRTARMVSYWISLLSRGKIVPPIVSEAINQSKNDYYYYLSETRDSNNDLTYFLTYIYDISLKYMLTYLNIDNIEKKLFTRGIELTSLEKNYVKKILISQTGKFSYNDFIKWIGIEMSKQGALKTLNQFESYQILNSEISKSNKKLFSFNIELIKYKTF